jgi:Formate hydrogenlyase subunit 3/Multisubunit Na+/H+ antiporter, MnhD subunit
MIVELLLAIPVIASALCFILPKGKLSAIVSIIFSLATASVAVVLCYDAFIGNVTEYSIWYVDSLSALFIILIATVSTLASLYSYGYIGFERKEGIINSKDERFYYIIFHLFVAVMFATCVVKSLGALWIAIEATTLVSAFLVGFYKKESSTEAAWKYIMICSVGITLALVGIMLIYASSVTVLGDSPGALDWIVLYNAAPGLDPELVKMSFVFIMIGFGTKMGLAPMHTWLPDAHSQSPSPISAMLSAVLLNCALYGLLRFKMITDLVVPGFTTPILIGFGLISLAVAAAFIVNAKDLKRMLAYSSVEHMGILAIGFGIGTPLAVFGALFHVMAHSLTKSLMFFAAGNAVQAYGTREMSEIRGMKEKMPFTAFMLTAGTLAIIGLPPFAIFLGEVTILSGAVGAGMHYVAAIMVLLIILIFAGFLRNIFPMMSGTTDKDVKESKDPIRAMPFIMLLIAVLFFGLLMPDQVKETFESIASLVTGGAV